MIPARLQFAIRRMHVSSIRFIKQSHDGKISSSTKSANVDSSIIADLPPIGYPPWKAGMQRRYAWPLFGMTECPPLPSNITQLCNATFNAGARYMGDESSCMQRPLDARWTEMTVIGRSNVGKSSLLNALFGSKDHSFVPVSSRPGSTSHLDFYALGLSTQPQLVLVDSPGYGYNKRGMMAGSRWLQLISDYYRNRNLDTLPRSLVLLDSKLGITSMDAEILEMLDGLGVPYHVVLTKVDTLNATLLETQVYNIATKLAKRALPYPVLNAVSAKTGEGIDVLKQTLIVSTKLHKK